ncbi:DeoR/GlpR family DNA-binding transcription regulator [uncultured Clostridium sp.]|uniref:DeoR/GlpR family DNA-binding transcription regulator n=1 Tax=uncultured Clostridium sp. TaxID=59620 RepID=UPI00261648B3|nr:DeoR/GlpR family DNA-binding transcription regulator [uncultured Clostridium sp.]
MLTEERYELILSLLKINHLVKFEELSEKLKVSDSTIRRDLKHLEERDLLKRFHGGAKEINTNLTELSYKEKQSKNSYEKELLAKYAANLVSNGESIFLDAGTTTFEIIKHLKDKQVFVVTNGLNHINALVENDIYCYMIGGNVKKTTKAIVGSHALNCLNKFNFDKCFIGANGIDIDSGFTTPDCEEASIKECAISNSKESYILSDISKFDSVACVKFAKIKQCTIISNKNKLLEKYKKITDVRMVTD